MLRDIPRDTLVDGRYRVISRVGSGGMADVYCAQDTQLGRNVALKLLHRRFAEDREFVERFRREASSAAGLQHPNVVAVYDRGEWDGTSYIAMEYLDGRTLKQAVNEEAPLDPIRAIDLTLQLLRAARFAHKRGVIHRDLKPHNAIVDAEGRLKVTDFGIARAGASDMTQTGSIMGTAQYLSPEQAQGHGVTPQSDLYSIGIVLYEMLTGRVPFDGESAVSIALKQVNEPPIPPSAYNGAVTPDLEGIVLHALAKDPAHRFADADAFILALERCRAGIADGTAPVGETAAFAAVPPPPELDPVPLLAADGRRGRRWWIALLALVLVVAAAAAAYALTRPDQRDVPNVTGRPLAAALAILQNAGFDPSVERTTSDAPEGRVLRQDPQPGERADEGSEVTLTVSNGPGTASVPDVSGQPRSRAEKALRDAGFRVRERREASDTITTNRVISTTPEGGTLAQRGSIVTVVLSTGAARVTVPDVVGQDVQDARDTLVSAGFRVDATKREDDSAEPGTILSQDPAGDGEARKGSTVKLVVAKESKSVDVPDVVGRGLGDALSTLAGAGLVGDPVDEPVGDEAKDGIVLRQSPKPGSRARKQSSVTITVGRYDPALDPAAQPPAPPTDSGPSESTPPSTPPSTEPVP